MTIASLGAFAIGEYPEAVAVMTLYCIGEALQDRAVSRARGNIKSLIAFRPDHAVVVRGDSREIVNPAQVKVGDIVEVKAGERVPVDGSLLGEAAPLDTAALTGESVPRVIECGGEVAVGTGAELRKGTIGAECHAISLLKHGDILLQGLTLLGKSGGQSTDEAVITLCKAKGFAINRHTVETFGIKPLPRQVHQSESAEDALHALSFAQAPNIMKACVEREVTTPIALDATAWLRLSLQHQHPMSGTGKQTGTDQSAKSTSYHHYV
jgi:hypothetical protein